jgi:hypothetical protein
LAGVHPPAAEADAQEFFAQIIYAQTVLKPTTTLENRPPFRPKSLPTFPSPKGNPPKESLPFKQLPESLLRPSPPLPNPKSIEKFFFVGSHLHGSRRVQPLRNNG